MEGDKRRHRGRDPDHALLVVEVAHTPLEYDRTSKQSLYAKAGIPEYWIVNLRERQVEVYPERVPREGLPFGYGYAQVARLSRGGCAAPTGET